MTEKPISPVLVVGGGPAGLALALSLVKNGVPVRIINSPSTPHQEARGQGIQPRTLEVFHFLGVLPELRAKGGPLKPVVFYKLPGGTEVMQTTHLSVPEEDTPTKPFNNTYQVAQYHTEAILGAHLEKYGCSVEFGTELVGLEQFEDRVEATIKKTVGDKEEIETQSFRWLVGADGGKSVVRKQSGFAFEGTAPEQVAILGEMTIEGLDTEQWHAWMRKGSGRPSIIMFGCVEGNRFFFMILGNPDPDKLLSSHEALLEAIRAHIDRTDLQMGEPYYVSDYRPSVRMVDKFSEGRVFLAGDAAHVHAPRGGQGLNSSVQDSFNLGWKLALVERGLAPRALLTTYNEERLPVIQRMLQETVDMVKRAKDAVKEDPAETARGIMQRTTLLKQLGINYRWSSIVLDERAPRAADEELEPYGVEAGDTLKAGDRAPNATGLVRLSDAQTTALFDIFSPTRHTVLIFGDDTSRAEAIVKALARYPQGTVSSVVVLPLGDKATTAVDGTDATLRDGDAVAYDAYRVTDDQPFTVIIRPDGVIGAIVSGEEGAAKYFGGIFSI
ncbi:hypothetical protein FOMPIDRAFT_1023761 [Fomitopsis schrenkii]|uniref:FAD-binding domain-containing protein n=1 Tax=Fomitopsis schrenkii TaxID=2126942 RepID=S8FPX5_FOMSC|nr:hypothetical protein FOMPIDRAFT_1023761 [Fomitopsis schrenkii]